MASEGKKSTLAQQERKGFHVGESYRIIIKHIPGASQPWSYMVFKGVTKLDSGSRASRTEAITSAELFANDHAANNGGAFSYDYTPELGG